MLTAPPRTCYAFYEWLLVKLFPVYDEVLVKSRMNLGARVNTNQLRRQARRQERGARRVESVLEAAAQVFAEVGYDEATTAAVAEKAGITAGSLYQFFPNKEAIARALGAQYAEQLQRLHETALTHENAALPLPDFLDRILDPIIAFNRAHPALMRLFGATRMSPTLASVFDEQHAGVIRQFDTAFAARLPHLDPVRRRRMVAVSLQIFLSLLPFTLDPDAREADAMVKELKAVLYGYWKPHFIGPAE